MGEDKAGCLHRRCPIERGIQELNLITQLQQLIVVGVVRIELTPSRSRTERAPICTSPR